MKQRIVSNEPSALDARNRPDARRIPSGILRERRTDKTMEHRMPRTALFLMFVSGVLAGCSHESASSFQGYVEGEYVYVASPVAGRLDRLSVQRGQTIADKAALFELESEQ